MRADDRAGHQGCGAGRRRPRPCRGAAPLRHEADARRALHPHHPRGRIRPIPACCPAWSPGLYGFDDAHIDTGPLARFAGARLYQGRGDRHRSRGQARHLRQPPAGALRLLSINIGSTPNTAQVPRRGRTRHSGQADRRVSASFRGAAGACRARAASAASRSSAAGRAASSCCLSLERRLRREADAAGRDPRDLSFVLISGMRTILPGFPARIPPSFRGDLRRAGHRDRDGEPRRARRAGPAASRADGAVHCRRRSALDDRGAPAGVAEIDGAAGRRCTASSGWTRRCGQRATTDVFAAGDIVAFGPRPLPKSGVYAVRAGAGARGKYPPRPDRQAPQRRTARSATRSISSRPASATRSARATASPSPGIGFGAGRTGSTAASCSASTSCRRWPPNRRKPPTISPTRQPSRKSRPSPCAAAAAARKSARRCCRARSGGLEPAPRDDILVGLDAPDDAAIVDTGGPKLSVQTVDYFRAIVDDPYLFGKIAANHALGDIFAMGGEPQSALAIATVPYGLEAKVEADLTAMMAGANEVLRAAGCALVGGHTREGAELALGFSVNGLVDARALPAQGGHAARRCADHDQADRHRHAARRRHARQGQSPLGYGGDRPHDAIRTPPPPRSCDGTARRAATDVTGFGLLGHLVEMVKASGVDASLELARHSAAGRRTRNARPGDSLLAAAAKCAGCAAPSAISKRRAAPPSTPRCSIRRRRAGFWRRFHANEGGACLAALHAAGYNQAAIIGAVTPRSDALAPITILGPAREHDFRINPISKSLSKSGI